MLILSGKQKRYLRSQANQLKPVFSLGKNGINKIWINEVLDTLSNKELIKVSVQTSASSHVDEFIDFIHSNSLITVVQKLGHTLILYLPNRNEKFNQISTEVDKIG